MERHPLRNTAIGLGLTSAILGGAILRPDQHIMSPEDYQIRDRVLSTYPFTQPAKDYLRTVPYFDRHTGNNGGGHYINGFFPYPPYTETGSDQDEAILHEFSHAYYDELVKEIPTFPSAFMNAVHLAVESDPTPDQYFKHLDWGFNQEWKGIDHSDVTEYYASISSKYMGKIKEMPEAIKHFYQFEFEDGE